MESCCCWFPAFCHFCVLYGLEAAWFLEIDICKPCTKGFVRRFLGITYGLHAYNHVAFVKVTKYCNREIYLVGAT